MIKISKLEKASIKELKDELKEYQKEIDGFDVKLEKYDLTISEFNKNLRKLVELFKDYCSFFERNFKFKDIQEKKKYKGFFSVGLLMLNTLFIKTRMVQNLLKNIKFFINSERKCVTL